MKQHEIKANEAFFKQILGVLSEGGMWVWKDHPTITFTKIEGKLVGELTGYMMVAEIVSPEFLSANFKRKK
jgi:hypothetical protein